VAVLAIPLVLASILLACMSMLGGISWIDAVAASRQASSSLPLAEGGGVSVTTTSGAIQIEAGPDGQVSVLDSLEVRSATRGLARSALDGLAPSRLSATASGVAVEVPATEPFHALAFQWDRRVTIRVPAAASVSFRGDSVAIELRRLTGKLDISVRSGAIRLKDVVVSSSDTVTTGAGAIDFEGSLAGGSLEIQTDSGAIRVQLPRGTNATYDAATSSGAIEIRPESGRPVHRSGTDRTATGVLGRSGGGAIKLRAGSGAIGVRVG
jgi:hypothetical protein